MKIQLERKLTTCPNRLRCTVCDRAFEVSKIRYCLETSTENIKFPTFYQWLIKHLNILPRKSQAPQTPISWLANFRSGKL